MVVIYYTSSFQTGLSVFLTNRLFGKGRTWNGKQFGTTNNPQQGVNRFYPRSNNNSKSSSGCETEHTFDMRLQPSKLLKDRRRQDTTATESNNNNNSLVLDYTHQQSPLSLWRTMMDEIRIVPLGREDSNAPSVMIGLGYMAWSGGRLNAAPFLLFRPTTPPKV